MIVEYDGILNPWCPSPVDQNPYIQVATADQEYWSKIKIKSSNVTSVEVSVSQDGEEFE